MAGRSERDLLRWDSRFGLERVVVGHQPRNVGEDRFGRRLAGERTDFHGDLKATRLAGP